MTETSKTTDTSHNMQLFFSNTIEENTIILDEEESKHCTKVLRKNIGDTIHIIDGKGTLYKAEIQQIGKKDCTAQIISKTTNFGSHSYYLRACVAPTKNIDRFEWFIEKAVEIGVDEIIPICSDNSERKILKLDRIERIILSAMKQSYKATMPILNELTPLDIVLQSNYQGIKCIAHCEQQEKQLFRDVAQNQQEITILIGPEGDFSLREIEIAKQYNWIPVSLGESRLRTETAGVAAVHTINLINQTI